ncbi:hypothetical protein RRG08_009308 [Elysia crispata]|uniref:Uncharacterized protein n=1 Tax=Elysia crispata TaxID=231223 RepID=A0AAE0XS28_9GAST|nr:hypothetical protein RRG08_009308 [Elysia crispata]
MFHSVLQRCTGYYRKERIVNKAQRVYTLDRLPWKREPDGLVLPKLLIHDAESNLLFFFMKGLIWIRANTQLTADLRFGLTLNSQLIWIRANTQLTADLRLRLTINSQLI